MKPVLLLALFAFFSLPLSLVAQGENTPIPEPSFGGFIHLNSNSHRAGFTRLPGVPNCCREFTGGNGLGLTVGALYDFPLSALLFLDVRAGYTTLGARLVEPENTTVIVAGQPTDATFEHQLESSLGGLVVEPALGYRPIPRLSLRAGGGLAYLMSSTYDQREELVVPETVGVFENGKRVRNEFEGDIPDVATMVGYAKIGLGYDFPLNGRGTLIGTPEIVYTRGFSSIVADSSWSVDALRIGLSVTFRSESDEQILPVVVQEDLPLPEDTVSIVSIVEPPEASVTAVGLTESGTEVSTATLRVEEFISTHMRPLLNYVFLRKDRM